MNKFQSMVVRVCGIKFDDEAVKFSVEQAQRATLQKGIDMGRKELPPVPDCSHCPIYLKTSPHEMTTFEQRPPTTEGKLQSEGIRYRALKHRWLEHPGTLMKHDKQMREQSQRATDGPHTERMPKVRFTTVKLDPMPPT